MAIQTLKDRINSYREVSSQKLMRRLPVIINVNGRGFRRLTSNIDKPYSNELSNVMCATAIKLCHEVDGAVFAYTFNDDIIIIARNDQSHETQAWFQNDVQKIVSASASIATLEFSNALRAVDLSLNGEATFIATAFTVPSITEAINVLIAKQQLAAQTSLNFSAFYELSAKYGDDAIDILQHRTPEDKEELLEECGRSYNTYPTAFRRGIACYRAPTLISSRDGGVIKNKWILNTDLPVFTKDQTFLANIFKSGSDIVRVTDY